MPDEMKNPRPLICRFSGGTNRNLLSLITCDGTYKVQMLLLLVRTESLENHKGSNENNKNSQQ